MPKEEDVGTHLGLRAKEHQHRHGATANVASIVAPRGDETLDREAQHEGDAPA